MLLILVILGLGFFADACFGFGGGLIAVPLLSLVMHPKDAVLLMLVFQCLKTVLLVSAWKHISWSVLKLLPIGILAGCMIGVEVLGVFDATLLRLLLATYLVIFVVTDELKLNLGNHITGYAGSFLAGLSGGVISGITGMGGPALATYLRTCQLGKDAFRATIMLTLAIMNGFRLALDFNDIFYSTHWHQYLLPALAVFVVVMPLGARVPKFLSERFYRKSVNALLFTSALLLFYRSLPYPT